MGYGFLSGQIAKVGQGASIGTHQFLSLHGRF